MTPSDDKAPPFSELNQPRNEGGGSVELHRLPDELLSRIFLLGQSVPLFGQEETWEWRSWRQYLAAITSVCLLWREIASHSPRLWSWIPITKTKKSHLHIEVLERHLQRAGAVPLHVYFDASTLTSASKGAHEWSWSLFESLAAHGNVETMLLIMDHNMLYEYAWMKTLIQSGAFKSLALKYQGSRDVFSIKIADSPALNSLRHLKIWTAEEHFLPHRLLQNCNFPNLAFLDVSKTTSSDGIMELLAHCPALEQLRIRKFHKFTRILNPITLNCLRILELVDDTPWGTMNIRSFVFDSPNVTHVILYQQWHLTPGWPELPKLNTITFKSIDAFPSHGTIFSDITHPVKCLHVDVISMLEMELLLRKISSDVRHSVSTSPTLTSELIRKRVHFPSVEVVTLQPRYGRNGLSAPFAWTEDASSVISAVKDLLRASSKIRIQFYLGEIDAQSLDEYRDFSSTCAEALNEKQRSRFDVTGVYRAREEYLLPRECGAFPDSMFRN